VARGLLASALPLIERQGITLIGITFGNLSDDRAIQLALPFERGGPSAVDETLDHVRDRFGSGAITRAVLLGRDHGPSVPLLPD
jgi:DNA polymerase-4